LEAPERLTPRRRSVRPEVSTKLKEVVWIKSGWVGWPVAGDIEGTEGIVDVDALMRGKV